MKPSDIATMMVFIWGGCVLFCGSFFDADGVKPHGRNCFCIALFAPLMAVVYAIRLAWTGK